MLAHMEFVTFDKETAAPIGEFWEKVLDVCWVKFYKIWQLQIAVV